MFSIPTDVLLTWPRPNFVNPERRGPELWIVTSISLFAAAFCVVIRLYSRIFVRRWFGPDDLLIILALVFNVGVTTCVAIANVHYDWNVHFWDVRPEFYSPSSHILYFSRIFWGASSSCVRLSVLCLYYRLLDSCRGPPKFYWVLHATLAYTVGLLIYYAITGIVPCLPIHAYWTALDTQSRCINDIASMEAAAVLNTFNEIVVATLPLLAVFRLSVQKGQRWSVVSVLSLGYLVAIAGCFRTYLVWKTFSTYDFTWWSSPQWMASEIEIDLALICACAAPIRPVITRLLRRIRSKPDSSPRVPRAFGGSRSQTQTQDSGAHFSRDFEAMSSWQTAVARMIDLEGISNRDGFGYVVQISGPARPRRKSLLAKLGIGLRKRNGVPQEDRNVQECKAGLEISHKTEVTVRESALQLQRFPSVSDAENNNNDDERRLVKPGFGEDAKMEKLDLEAPPAMGHTFLDTSSNLALTQSAAHAEKERSVRSDRS